MTDDLVTWLREQIAETRRIAEAAHEMAPGPWGTPPVMGYDIKEIRRHEALNAPPAVLAQCDAHELILTLVETVHVGYAAVRALALAYQHRPGYREEWRP